MAFYVSLMRKNEQIIHLKNVKFLQYVYLGVFWKKNKFHLTNAFFSNNSLEPLQALKQSLL